MSLNKFIDNFLEIFLSKDKTKLYLFLIMILGLILRIIAASNLMVGADDSHFATHAINFLGSGKLETYDQSAPLWFSITDFFYSVFGVNQISSRLAALLFGTLSIPLIFLLTKRFFGKKAGLIAAFLLAISPFHIKNTLAEMDVTVMFFVMFGVYLFISFLNKEKKSSLIFSAIALGLAVMTKVYALLFLPGLVIYALYKDYKKNKRISSKIIKNLVLFSFIIFIFVIPILTHNYLLYKDKRFTDFMFSGILGIGKEKSTQFYSWDPGWGTGHDYKGFFFGNSRFTPQTKLPGSVYTLGYLFNTDPIVFALGFLGLLFALFKKEKRDYIILFLLLFILPWMYIGSIMLLAKHFIFELLLFLPFAGFFLERIHNKMSKIRLKYILILILIFNLVFLGMTVQGSYYAYYHFYDKSPQSQLMNFKSSIPDNALVVTDSRIYRGQIAWALNDKEYLEASYFLNVYLDYARADRNPVAMEVYYVECGIDDCGWGGISGQPELNKSMEDLVDAFSYENLMYKEIKAKGPGNYIPFIDSQEPETYYKIYKKRMMLNSEILLAAKSTHVWFHYPLRYDRGIIEIFDEYLTYNAFDSLLNDFARFIIYAAIFFSLIYGLMVILLYIYEDE